MEYYSTNLSPSNSIPLYLSSSPSFYLPPAIISVLPLIFLI